MDEEEDADESGRNTRDEEALIAAEIAAEYGNDQGDVLSLFDDIARELVLIGDGAEGNHDFIQASHNRRTMTVTLWGGMEVGQGPLTPEWIADFRTSCWLAPCPVNYVWHPSGDRDCIY